MILVDDLLVKPFVSLLETLHTVALEECYDVEAIQDELKENQLLYDLDELDAATYRERKAELEEELALAREVREELGSGRVEVKT